MGCGASSNKTEGGQGSAAASPLATTGGEQAKNNSTASLAPAHTTTSTAAIDSSKPSPAPSSSSPSPVDTSKDALSTSPEVRDAVAKRHQLEQKNAVGQAIDVTKQLLTSGGQVADQANTSLQSHKAGLAYDGRTGLDDISTAQAVFDSLSVLSGSSDLKKAAAAGWVVVSESSKFFTIGKVAIAIIEQIYNLWNAWDKKVLWVGTFIAFLKVVEEELVAGMNTFEHVEFLRALESQLEQSRDLLRVIQCRSTPMAFLMSTSDELALNQQKDLIVARKQECLFGHAVEIKATTAENLALLQEIQQLLAQRQKQIEEYKLHPEGPEAFAREQKRIRGEFAVISPIEQIESLQNRWIRFQRSRRFQQMNSFEELKKYVDDYWSEFLLTDRSALPSTKSEYFQSRQTSFGDSEKKAESQQFAALSYSDQLKQLKTLKDDADRLLKDITATGTISQNQTQPIPFSTSGSSKLLNSLASASEKGSQCVNIWNTLNRLHSLVSPSSVSPSPATTQVSSTSSNESIDWSSYLESYSSSLFSSLQQIQAAQLSHGFLISPFDPNSASIEQLRSHLSSFQRISRIEKTYYVNLFQSYYRSELEQIEWALDLSPDAAKRKEGQPTKGKILAIRAPPPNAAATPSASVSSTPSSPYACSSPLSSDDSCSIFLAFLVELYPSAFRATHFAADTNEFKHAFEVRAGSQSNDIQTTDTENASDVPSSDAIARNDIHRAFPSLALQLFAALPIYEANVMAKGSIISRDQFNQQNPSDFIVELFSNYMEHEGRLQTPPPTFVEPLAFNSRPSDPNAPLLAKQRKVCVSIDAGQFLSSSLPSAISEIKAAGYDWDDSLLDALTKHVRNIPDWMCFVITIPFKSKFDRKVLYTGQPGCSIALNLSKPACTVD